MVTDREAWPALVPGVPKYQTPLSDWTATKEYIYTERLSIAAVKPDFPMSLGVLTALAEPRQGHQWKLHPR